MLKTNKSKTLSGHVVIDDQQVIHLSGTVSTGEGNTHVSYSINDHNAYVKNKAECREGIENFLKEIFKVEDVRGDESGSFKTT